MGSYDILIAVLLIANTVNSQQPSRNAKFTSKLSDVSLDYLENPYFTGQQQNNNNFGSDNTQFFNYLANSRIQDRKSQQSKDEFDSLDSYFADLEFNKKKPSTFEQFQPRPVNQFQAVQEDQVPAQFTLAPPTRRPRIRTTTRAPFFPEQQEVEPSQPNKNYFQQIFDEETFRSTTRRPLQRTHLRNKPNSAYIPTPNHRFQAVPPQPDDSFFESLTSSTTPAVPIAPVFPTQAPVFQDIPPRRLSSHKSTPTRVEPSTFSQQEFDEQARNAKYKFASNVDDDINSSLHQRVEVRDGVNVKGKYSFSDGYYRRTVHYEADDKGYRVVKEDVEPIGDGPKFNPDGTAKVDTYVAGHRSNYQITKDDINKKKLFINGEEFDDEF